MPAPLNFPIDAGQLEAELPTTLPDLVMATLQSHVGRDNAIRRRDLLLQLGPHMSQIGVPPGRMDRNLRLAIRALRKRGCPICSTGGSKGGYFLAADRSELDQYLVVEVHGRAIDLLEQEKAMRQGAERLWSAQPPLL
jgi:hypothetical protein